MIGKNIKICILTLILCVFPVTLFAFPASHYAEQSKLAEGTWVRLMVDESGVYQITSQDAVAWGLGDLEHVHVFGRGGAPMSEYITEDQVDDLPQVPVVRTEGKILFYAQGPVTWKYGATFNYTQTQHPYANEAYYFVTNDTSYTDVAIRKSEEPVSGTPVSTFTERLFHEEELTNPGESGRTLLGEDFMTTSSRSFPFDLKGWVPGSEVKVKTVFAAKVNAGDLRLYFQQNGNNLPFAKTDTLSSKSNTTGEFYRLLTSVKSFVPSSQSLNYELKANISGGATLLRLDCITVNYQRSLRLDKGMLMFGATKESSGSVTFEISGASERTHVWDVTAPWAPIEMNVTYADSVVRFSPVQSGAREYAAFDERGTMLESSQDGKVREQNLHGEPTPDMIIITHSKFQQQAQRLANHHADNDGMRVLVAEQEKVFNEFSSGTPDAMAYRMLCKMMWDRGVDTAGHHLRYLLLMGDGLFDNRGISLEAKSLDKNTLLTWQSEKSETESNSFSTDDFFGVLKDDDGRHTEFYIQGLDIAVGRLPVSDATEAKTVVDKIIDYATESDFGVWKNTMLSVADDRDNGVHMEQAEAVIQKARESGGEGLMYNHIFIDAYPEYTVGAARTYPEAKAQMLSTLKEGVLWWNYTGHASPNNWGSEGMLRRTDITDNLFYEHLPLLYASTCEFARFDAMKESGSENMVLNARGGAIAVMSPCRQVYMTYNGGLNKAVAGYLLSLDDKGFPRRIGDVLRMGKNEIVSSSTSELAKSNNSRYMLLGDPALRLAMPNNKVVIETINGAPVNSKNRPQFKARQTITMTGSVTDHRGQKLTDFNGSVHAVLYDSEQSVVTHGYGTDGKEFTYLDRPNKLAITIDTVSAGSFTLKMTIPSELVATFENYSPSLINMYAWDTETHREANGSNTDFYIYGYDDKAPADSVGPNIEFLCLNSRAFNDGDEVNESPLVIASISDPSGLNFSTAGVGHTMTLLLDEKQTFSDLSGYYTPALTSEGTLGSLSYQLSDISAGHHTLRLRVWDVYNNMSEKTISFNVALGAKPEVVDVYATDNPARTSTTFYVEHNRPDANMQMTIEVFDLMGRPVWSTTQSGKSNMFMSFPIVWDLTGKDGRRVPRGIYIYRASISTDGEHEVSKGKKLAVCAE